MIKYFLIVTMGSHYGISYQGFGGVSITPTESLQQCIVLQHKTYKQLKRTPNIDIDDVILTCEGIKTNDQ